MQGPAFCFKNLKYLLAHSVQLNRNKKTDKFNWSPHFDISWLKILPLYGRRVIKISLPICLNQKECPGQRGSKVFMYMIRVFTGTFYKIMSLSSKAIFYPVLQKQII